jgi:Chlamydia polymorphic membrane protein (Chlamydia_PMP) repeat
MSRRQQRRRALRRRTHVAVASGGAAALASLATGGVAHAQQTFTVTNLNDSGTGSLRAAIASVNADTTDTSAPGDSIVFESGLSGTIALSSGQLSLYQPAVIIGPGAGTLTVEASPNARILYADADLTISGLTLTGGAAPSSVGGAIVAEDPLTIDESVLTDNSANYGGAVFGYGGLTVNGSTFSGNSATSVDGQGGAILSFPDSVTISDSTLSDNTATTVGGAVYANTGSVTVNNSTVTGNTANSGAIASTGDATLNDSTVAENTVTSGGSGGQVNVFKSGTTATINDSIVSGTGSAPDVVLGSGVTGSASYSLIRDPSAPSGDTAITTSSSDITGQDPQLGPLQFNDGSTETMMPSPTSPVLDQGKAFGFDTDQRGLPRPFVLPTITSVPAGGDHSDMGAVEVETPRITGIYPTSGKSGSQVAVGGVGFNGATQVMFGSTPASSFTVLNDGAMTAVAPAGAGTEDIRVITPLGESPAVSADRFAFPTFRPTVGRPHPKLSGDKLNTGVIVVCPFGGVSCTGNFKATAFIKHHKTKLASGSINLSPAGDRKIKFALSGKALRQLKKAGKLKITLQIVIADGGETPMTVDRTITLKYKARSRKR